jgi:hypothetical protein
MSVCESTRNLAIETMHRGAELGEASMLHLHGCDECRGFVERTQRMSASVYADEPTAAEVLRLRVRLGSGIAGLGSGRPVYTRRPRWQFALAASFVLLSGSVVAATGGQRLLDVVGIGSGVAPSETPAEVSPQPRKPRKMSPAPAAGPEAVIDVEALELEADPPSAPAPRPRSQHPKAEAKWADVAKSLRSKNYDKAQKSLGELSQSGDAVERDTARLSLAQLWLQQGKTVQARQLLRELSASGASPFIRRRAGELLP